MSKPNPLQEDCIQTVCDSRTKVEENGRKAIFLNPENAPIKKVRIDGCLIVGDTRRADFIVSKPGVVDVIVELKGKDIYHAKDQIVATLSFWKTYPPFSEKIAGLIICSRSPMSSSELQVMKAKVQNQHHLSLIVDENGKKEYHFAVFI
ncbi:MAG: hypothetical protein WCA21_01165 [Terracidiphilus sp.]